MTRRVGVDLNAPRRITIGGGFQQSTTQIDDLLMGSVVGFDALDIEIEVHLLRSTIGPIRRNMVRSQLHTQRPFSIDKYGTPPVAPFLDGSTQQRSPERTLRVDVGSIEDDHAMFDIHDGQCVSTTQIAESGCDQATLS